jgi:hypothetical protein
MSTGKTVSLLVLLNIVTILLGAPTTAVFILTAQLPDPYFVGSECSSVLRRARAHSQPLSNIAIRLCADFQSQRIQEEAWLEGMNELESELSPRFMPFSIVPRDYQAYSLFLVPSAEWKYKPADLGSLHNAFLNFGEAIGPKNAAVWFVKGSSGPIFKTSAKEIETLMKSVDIERSKYYCDKLNLNYNEGPFVVTTRRRPDLLRSGDEIIVIKFHDIDGSRITSVLNVLEQDLRTQREISKRTLLYEEIKQRIQTAAGQHSESLRHVLVELLKL